VGESVTHEPATQRATGSEAWSDAHLAACIGRAQGGDCGAVEELLQQFRPLLRSRMHRLWSALCNDISRAEWDDVEAHVQMLF
jgi:hypothetical protein